MAALMPLAASLALLLAGNVGVETDLEATARARQVTLEDVPSRSLAELEVTPRLALFRDGLLRAAAAYRPRLRVPYDLEGVPAGADGSAGSGDLEVLHRGEVLLEAPIRRDLTIRLRGEGGYGTTDLLSTALFSSQPIATTSRIRFIDAQVTAGLSAMPTRRTTFSLEAGALEVGGAGPAAREVLPLQRAARLDAALGWNATRIDVLSAVVAATASRFEPISHAAAVRGGGAWQHGVSRTLVLRSGVGTGFAWTDIPGTDPVHALTPWAEVALMHTPRGPRPSADVGIRLDAAADPVSRRIDQRLEAHAAVTWQPGRSWTLATRASGAAIRPTANGFDIAFHDAPTRVGALEARAIHRISSRVSISVAASGRWQRTAAGGVESSSALPSFVEWSGLVGISVGARWHDDAPRFGPPSSRASPGESGQHGS